MSILAKCLSKENVKGCLLVAMETGGGPQGGAKGHFSDFFSSKIGFENFLKFSVRR